MVDLHVHSSFSDGTFSPKELVEYALANDITAFALTDHDTTAGLSQAVLHARALSGKVCEQNPSGSALEVIPGIEFSTEYEGRDVHIVGLFIDYEGEVFQKHLSAFVESRNTRNEKMCALLRAHDIDITYEMLQKEFPDAVITRAHYAKFLLQKHYVKSMQEAFDRYIGDRASCFVPREKVTPAQAIRLTLETGGLPVLAHPVLYRMGKERMEKLVKELKAEGLMAIEAYYSSYTASDTIEMLALSKKYHLLPSGGSDFHGENKPGFPSGQATESCIFPKKSFLN